ncbi:MAG: alpha/beta fold hydrolase, partial [Lachnospiraceae bacterium]|nr:alpha/beta fold hydrolase [Lachnospiraceae bacterium]
MDTKKISINEYEIKYLECGLNDSLCVFLHGWGACKENFLPTIELLKSKYRCVALDLPGFGESDKLKKSFSVDD